MQNALNDARGCLIFSNFPGDHDAHGPLTRMGLSAHYNTPSSVQPMHPLTLKFVPTGLAYASQSADNLQIFADNFLFWLVQEQLSCPRTQLPGGLLVFIRLGI